MFCRPFFYITSMPSQTKNYTVTQINNNINHILTADFTDISIEGEISSYKISPNGHLYFTLVDKTSELSCVMFNNDYLNKQFDCNTRTPITRYYFDLNDKSGYAQALYSNVKVYQYNPENMNKEIKNNPLNIINQK